MDQPAPSTNIDKFNSAAREVLTALGAAALQFGLMEDQLITTVSGAVLAAVMVGWALYNHAGAGVLGTLLRKLISCGAGVAVAYGALTPEKAEALSGVILVIISLYYGNRQATATSTPPETKP